MFNGTNASGKEFDVIDEDGAVMSSHDNFSEAADALRLAAGFYLSRGNCRLRRDSAIAAGRHASDMRAAALRRAMFADAYDWK
jgi:hypothetical protein